MTTMNEIVGIVALMLASAMLGATIASLLVANIVHSSRDAEVAELTQKNGDLVAQLVMYEQAKSPVVVTSLFDDVDVNIEDEPDHTTTFFMNTPAWADTEWLWFSAEEVEVYETYMRGGETHEAAVAYILSLRDGEIIERSGDEN